MLLRPSLLAADGEAFLRFTMPRRFGGVDADHPDRRRFRVRGRVRGRVRRTGARVLPSAPGRAPLQEERAVVHRELQLHGPQRVSGLEQIPAGRDARTDAGGGGVSGPLTITARIWRLTRCARPSLGANPENTHCGISTETLRPERASSGTARDAGIAGPVRLLEPVFQQATTGRLYFVTGATQSLVTRGCIHAGVDPSRSGRNVLRT